jgi:hypothetical protein
MTGSDKTKLDGIAAGAEVNVQSDWNAISGDALILNKPTIPAAYTDSSVDTHLNTSTAATNEVLSWNGSDYDWVAQSGGGGGGLFASYAIFTHAATVDGGSINTASSWLTRPLNTTDVSQSWASLSSNQVTLSAGTYLIEWESTVHRVSFNQSRLRNVTDGTTIGAGLLGRANSGDEASWNSSGCAQLVITGSKVIEVQHWVLATKANNGWGDYTNTGENNIYAILKITKHA